MMAITDLPICSYDNTTTLDQQLLNVINPCGNTGGGGTGILLPPPPPPQLPIENPNPTPRPPAPGTTDGLMTWIKANAWLVALVAAGGLIIYSESKKKRR